MSEDVVQKVKSALSISDVVGRYVQLQKKGKRHMGCCPFHHEKTPSFSVDNQQGFYYCFGCKQGGDHFGFIQSIENMSFFESLEFLADLAGVEIPKRGNFGADRKAIDLFRDINEQACQFFERRLSSDNEAMKILKERGLNEHTIRLFRLGVAPDQWDGLYQHLFGKFPEEALAKSGLFKPGKTGRFYDLFRDRRIMFPIFDVHGHVVAFGARRTGEDGPKYINSPESPIYIKGKHVYNLNFARAYLKKQPDIIVVEGYMDVIQVYQAGIGAVVAPLGTAFTPEQARLIKRYARQVILNFDGDQAGFLAARKSIEVLVAQDLDPKVISLPQGMDPDDFIVKQGVDTYRQKITEAQDFFEFLFQMFHPANQEMNPRHASSLIHEILPTLKQITDPVVQYGYLCQLADRTGASMESIQFLLKGTKQELKPDHKTQIQRTAPRISAAQPSLSVIEEHIVRILLKAPDAINVLQSHEKRLFHEVFETLFEDRPWVQAFLLEHEADRAEILRDMPDKLALQLKQILMDDEQDPVDDDEARYLLLSHFNDITMIYLKRQSTRITEMRRTLDDTDIEKITELRRRKAEIEKKIRELRSQIKQNKGRPH